MKRKTFLAVALIGAAAAAHLPAQAQSAVDFPNKPVTLFTAFAPGSGPDATLRLVADKLGRLWNQRVMVENRPGGGGFIAMEAARRAAADGYTLLQLDSDHLGAVLVSVVRRPGASPIWSVSWSELVDQAGRSPAPDTLAWYRLACTLPDRLPAQANLARGDADRSRALRDYALIKQELGVCARTRK